MEGRSRLSVIDGTNLFHRSWHALAEHELSQGGEPTFAVYGTVNTIASTIRSHQPTHVVVVFDWGKSAYRLAIWPKYKAGRPDSEVTTTPDGDGQMAALRSLLPTLGVHVWRERDVEADDVIAAVVERFKDEVDDVLVVTGDKDMRQLADANVTIVHPSLGARPESQWTRQGVVEHYGVPPERLPEVWALCGDKVDNVPGVKGIGETTAIRLIQKYGDLSRVSLSSEKKIEGFRHDILMSEKLVRLNPSLSSFAPILADIAFHPRGPKDAGAEEILVSLSALGFESLTSRWSNGTLWVERGLRLRDLKSHK